MVEGGTTCFLVPTCVGAAAVDRVLFPRHALLRVPLVPTVHAVARTCESPCGDG